jgi:AcrR family transcriptional regulator
MKTGRVYRLRARAVSARATRERIVGAMLELFRDRWYDEIALRDVAERAGVALQTVLNHFASKEGLLTALVEDPRLLQEFGGRLQARPGDVRRGLELLVDDYERAGDAMIRLLALEPRAPSLKPALDMGRIGHRLWLDSLFDGRLEPARLDLLVCATDVYTWRILRRDQGHSREATLAAISEMVEALTR